jgi:hypothetical protein
MGSAAARRLATSFSRDSSFSKSSNLSGQAAAAEMRVERDARLELQQALGVGCRPPIAIAVSKIAGRSISRASATFSAVGLRPMTRFSLVAAQGGAPARRMDDGSPGRRR